MKSEGQGKTDIKRDEKQMKTTSRKKVLKNDKPHVKNTKKHSRKPDLTRYYTH
jgi:hypothetical protein